MGCCELLTVPMAVQAIVALVLAACPALRLDNQRVPVVASSATSEIPVRV